MRQYIVNQKETKEIDKIICNQCGKEISDQAKFCKYCGNQMISTPPQKAPATPKKSKFLSNLVTILVAVAVFFGVRAFAMKTMSGNSNKKPVSNNDLVVIDTQPSAEEESEIDVAMESCYYGGLYEQGTLRYGMTKLYVPGFSVWSGEEGEQDWLISEDSSCLIGAYKNLEMGLVSYKASTSEGVRDSFLQSYSDVNIIAFDKIYVNNFPVIRYIIGYTAGNTGQYCGELIVFPRETTSETIRLTIVADALSNYGPYEIMDILETLEVSPDLSLTYEDTQVVDPNRITVK